MSDKKVLVYISKESPSCQELLRKMDQWGVEYKTKNVTEDNSNKKELQDYGVYGTPATFINNDNEPILGFQLKKIKRELNISE